MISLLEDDRILKQFHQALIVRVYSAGQIDISKWSCSLISSLARISSRTIT